MSRHYSHAKSAGKGHAPRKVNMKKFGQGWEKAFKRKGKFK